MRERELMKCSYEHGVYERRRNNNKLILLCLYIDYLLITRSCKKEIEEFNLDLMKEFEVSDLGIISYFLGIQFYKCGKGLLIHQKRYESEILNIFKIEHCNSLNQDYN